MASKKETKPYIPPIIKRLDERGGGPLTPAASLLSRMGTREVDDEVIAVVAWALSFFQPLPDRTSLWEMPPPRPILAPGDIRLRVERELLNDLGLEWFEEPMGGQVLRPKEEFQGKAKLTLPEMARQHGGWEEGNRWYFPSARAKDDFAREATSYTAKADVERILSNLTIKRGGKAK